MNVDRHEPVNAIIVFDTIWVDWKGFVGKYPALNDGQNIHKNKVPIIANVEFVVLVSTFLVTGTFLQSIKQTVSPK